MLKCIIDNMAYMPYTNTRGALWQNSQLLHMKKKMENLL